jgi:hypothetical protein
MDEPMRDDEVERILRSCRPAGPRARLRDRVLSASGGQGARPARRPWLKWLVRCAIPAAILLAVALRIAPALWLMAVVWARPARGF